MFPSGPCPPFHLAPQVASSTSIISTLCRRSRRAARINLLFLKENYIFLYWMIYDMCADRFLMFALNIKIGYRIAVSIAYFLMVSY